MNIVSKPDIRPSNPCFSSGPCAKRPDWNIDALKKASVGRSHRSRVGKGKLREVIDRTRNVLNIPDEWKIAIVPGSDTGAVEMAMWSLLGERGVDVLAWESFGSGWVTDIKKQLKLDDVRLFEADYGKLPDLSQVDTDRDVVFTWNGTTSGVKVPNADWIKDDRKGLTICDATSAIFAMELPLDKLDVITYSWQKALGGEGAHGMIILSPRAIERLESYTPPWPLPKVFRMTKGGKLIDGLFLGETINTPSMICVEDAIDALIWAEKVGNGEGMIKRSESNLAAIEKWVESTDWVEFLAEDKSIRSSTSICLKIVDSWYNSLPLEEQKLKAKQIATILEGEAVAYDIASYRDAPAGLRIWGGATIETGDIEILTKWLDWAFYQLKDEAVEAA